MSRVGEPQLPTNHPQTLFTGKTQPLVNPNEALPPWWHAQKRIHHEKLPTDLPWEISNDPINADSDPEHVNGKPRIKRFRLWVVEEQEELDTILDRIGRGYAAHRYDVPQYVPEHENWIILLSWVDWCREISPNEPTIVSKDAKVNPQEGRERVSYAP